MADITHINKTLEVQVERDGYKKGTPDYKKELLTRRLTTCQNLRGVTSCGSCNYAEFCSLLKDYYMIEKY